MQWRSSRGEGALSGNWPGPSIEWLLQTRSRLSGAHSIDQNHDDGGGGGGDGHGHGHDHDHDHAHDDGGVRD